MKKKVLIIVGPTAAGKSALAVRLARKFNGEIISADSRQVYKGLDIGTGKITKKEKRGVPHHLLDVTNPRKQFSVYDFIILTNEAIVRIVNINKIPIVVGGTGFYIDTLTGKFSLPNVPSNKLLREKLNKFNKEKLFEMLRKKDPACARTIDKHNKVRLIRALEIVAKIGSVPTLGSPTSKYNFKYIGLKPGDLDRRIRRRLMKRIEPMIREAKKLIKLKAVSYRRMHELGLEYRYVAKFLKGQMTKNQMTNELYQAIRQYAKRQMTWFKRNKKIKWFTSEEYRKIEKYVRMKLKWGD